MTTHAELSAATGTLFAAVDDRGAEALELLLRDQQVLLVCPSCRWNTVAGLDHPATCEQCDTPLGGPSPAAAPGAGAAAARPQLTETPELATLTWQGYSVTMYRSATTGDMVVDVRAPSDYADTVTVSLNDELLSS